MICKKKYELQEKYLKKNQNIDWNKKVLTKLNQTTD